ncbi:MAG: hypothetical protein ABIJ41_04650 [Candidatus Omnitrophota bacterium]
MKNSLKFSWLFLFSLIWVYYIQTGICFGQIKEPNSEQGTKKRDPFVALVDPNGNIRSWEELFPRQVTTPINTTVNLSAILWDEKRPLALINGKIFSEGQEITKGIRLEKINPNSIELNNNGAPMTIVLRKIKKEWIR